eukprot:12904566-Prorocentrum_lima.AAC.1
MVNRLRRRSLHLVCLLGRLCTEVLEEIQGVTQIRNKSSIALAATGCLPLAVRTAELLGARTVCGNVLYVA